MQTTKWFYVQMFPKTWKEKKRKEKGFVLNVVLLSYYKDLRETKWKKDLSLVSSVLVGKRSSFYLKPLSVSVSWFVTSCVEEFFPQVTAPVPGFLYVQTVP